MAKKKKNQGNTDAQHEHANAEEEPLDSVFKRLETTEEGLTDQEAQSRVARYGLNEIPEEKQNPVLQYLMFMWNPLSWAMEVAAIISIVFLDYVDFGLIIGLLFLNATLGFWEEYNAGNAIAALKEQLVANASVLRNGQWKSIAAKDLTLGDIVRMKLGEVVSADLKMIKGHSVKIDAAALTGESLPVDKNPGDMIFAGSAVKQGEFTAVVTAIGVNTFFGKSATLMEGDTTGHFQAVLRHIGFFCISIIIVFVIVEVLVEFLARDNPCHSLAHCPVISNCIVLIAGGVPIAMPTVLSITMAVGASQIAQKKAIVSRLTAVEELAAMDMLVSDKTGTLTKSHLEVAEPWPVEGATAESVMTHASLCSSHDEDADAIDKSIVDYSKNILQGANVWDQYKTIEYIPYNPESKRSQAKIRSNDGKIFLVTKGAPQKIIELLQRKEDYPQIDDKVLEFASGGYRTLAVAVTEGDEASGWKLEGLIPLSDPPREDTAQTIKRLYEQGVKVKMITGDQLAIAKEIAKRIGMGTNIKNVDELKGASPDSTALDELIIGADGFAQVLPEHKFIIVKRLQTNKFVVGMTGDGVNDAPALNKADIGIAVSGATSAARAASDIVLLAPGLTVINDAILTSRIIFQRMKSYSTYAVTTTVRIVLTFFLLTIIWNWFFPPILILILAITNDGTMLAISKDRVRPSQGPEKWNLFEVFGVAIALAVYLTGCTLCLFALSKNTFVWHSWFGLHQLSDEELRGLVYLNVSITGFASLLVVRTHKFFWESRPGWFLLFAVVLSQTVATFIAVYGFHGYPDDRMGFRGCGWGYALIVWIWSIIWSLPMDLIKITTRKILAPFRWTFIPWVNKFWHHGTQRHLDRHVLSQEYHLKPHLKKAKWRIRNTAVELPGMELSTMGGNVPAK